ENHSRFDLRALVGGQTKAAIVQLLKIGAHFLKMENRLEGFDLLHEIGAEFSAGDFHAARNVEDDLFRIELSALAARTIQNVHYVGRQTQKAQFENGKKPNGACTNDHDIGAMRRTTPSIRHVFLPHVRG